MMDEYPFEFSCRRSGNCCARPGGSVRVGDEDVEAIAKHFGMRVDAVRSRFVERGRVLKSGFGGRCVFLEDGATTSCAIYTVRPERCRTWPYWPELLRCDRELAEAMRLCPGIRRRGSRGARGDSVDQDARK